MMRTIYIIAIALLVVACDPVLFEEPQPRKVKTISEIPEAMHGVYYANDGDSLIIGEKFIVYILDAIIDRKPVYLSDSTILKYYKGRYFLNLWYDVDDEHYWDLYLIDFVEDSNILNVYTMDPGDIVKLAKLQEITSKVRDLEDDEGDEYYLFAPKKKHYKKIIADSVFTKMISFNRVAR